MSIETALIFSGIAGAGFFIYYKNKSYFDGLFNGTGLPTFSINTTRDIIESNITTGVVEKQPRPISQDVDTLARTMWGEARNEGDAGMQAVANVVMNRYSLSQTSSSYARRFGATVAQICQKPYQFSVWNNGDPNLPLMRSITTKDTRFASALKLAQKAVDGELRDLTGGADHYLNIAFTKEIRGGSLPNWADLRKKTKDIGRHTFLKLV